MIPILRFGRRVLLGAVLLLGGARPLTAQQEEPVRIEYERIQTDSERGIFFLDGRCRIRHPSRDLSFRADRIVIWSTAKKTELPDEIYAEGHVEYRRGKNVLRVPALYMDFRNDRAYAADLYLHLGDPKLKRVLWMRADHLRGIEGGGLRLENLRVSTCSYGIPHYDVTFAEVELTGRSPKAERSVYDLVPFESWDVKTSGMVPHFEGIPFFYLPGYDAELSARQDFPLRSIQGGTSTRFGPFVYADWGFRVTKGPMDGLNPWNTSGEEDDEETWGELIFETDWRRERGGAYGLDLQGTWEGYSGYVDSYYLYDLGRNPESEFDLKFDPLRHKDRGRVRTFHRQEIDDHWRAELEVSYLADRDLLEEFFPVEFKEGKEQESVAYLRYRDGNFGGYLLQRNRLNEFQTQVEYLPKLESHWIGEPVSLFGTRLFTFTQRTQAAHLRRRLDQELLGSSDDLWRVDVYEELAAPIETPAAIFTPLGGYRMTWFEDDLYGGTDVRHLWSAGVRASQTFHGVHDMIWEEVGLRRLRHLLQAEVRYTSNLYATDGAPQYEVFDEVDRLDEFDEIALVVRNRFQTKNSGGQTNEFLVVTAAVEYYPDEARDTLSLNENNPLGPFYWITLAPDSRGVYERRQVSNIHWEVDFRPENVFFVSARGEYNSEASQEEVREISAGFRPAPDLTVSARQTLLHAVTDAFGFESTVKLAEKWTFLGSLLYDFDRNEYVNRKLIVGRDMHDFILEADFERNDARDDSRFYITVVPKFFGKRARQYETTTR